MAGKTKRKRASPGAKAYEVPEEMKHWAALLSQEVSGWPQVTVRKMFGMSSFYRKGAIFAAVPSTKAFFSPTSIIFKLQRRNVRQQKWMVNDSRINASFGIGQKWYGYQLQSDSDLNGALEWLGEAFEAARSPVTT